MSDPQESYAALLINPVNRAGNNTVTEVINFYVIPVKLPFSETPPVFSAGVFSEGGREETSNLSVQYTYDVEPGEGAPLQLYPFVFRKQYPSNENNPIDLTNVELKLQKGDDPSTKKSGTISVVTDYPLVEEEEPTAPENLHKTRVKVARQKNSEQQEFGPYYLLVLNLTYKNTFTNRLIPDGSEGSTLLFDFDIREEPLDGEEEYVAAFGVYPVEDTDTYSSVQAGDFEATIDYSEILYF